MTKEDKLRKQLTDNLALHQRALADLKAAHSKAEEALRVYRTRRVFDQKHAQEREVAGTTTILNADGSSRLPMADMVLIDGNDFEEESINRERRRLAGEVSRIDRKIRDIKSALASLGE